MSAHFTHGITLAALLNLLGRQSRNHLKGETMSSREMRVGCVEMSVAMLISGTVGWLVVSSQQTPLNVVFIRCVFGAATLFVICAFKGMLRKNLF